MTDATEIEEKFWQALKDDGIVMLGVDGVENGFARPTQSRFLRTGRGISPRVSLIRGTRHSKPTGQV